MVGVELGACGVKTRTCHRDVKSFKKPELNEFGFMILIVDVIGHVTYCLSHC